MKMSGRAERMQRHHKRWGRGAALNMVSLMDIFTILVFFLLVNSSDGEVLPSTRSVQLPESIAEDKPRETVVVMVTDTDILLDGRKVASIADVTAAEFAVAALKTALDEQSANALRIDPGSSPEQREITIMGNKTVPFSVLKKVMATCTDAGYGHVSLAVLQRAPDKG